MGISLLTFRAPPPHFPSERQIWVGGYTSSSSPIATVWTRLFYFPFSSFYSGKMMIRRLIGGRLWHVASSDIIISFTCLSGRSLCCATFSLCAVLAFFHLGLVYPVLQSWHSVVLDRTANLSPPAFLFFPHFVLERQLKDHPRLSFCLALGWTRGSTPFSLPTPALTLFLVHVPSLFRRRDAPTVPRTSVFYLPFAQTMNSQVCGGHLLGLSSPDYFLPQARVPILSPRPPGFLPFFLPHSLAYPTSRAFAHQLWALPSPLW